LASCCQRTPTIPLPSGRAAFDKLAARQRGAGHSLARPQTAPRSRIPRSLPTCASVPHAQLADAGSAIMPTPGNPRPVSASPRPVLGQSLANPWPGRGASSARPRARSHASPGASPGRVPGKSGRGAKDVTLCSEWPLRVARPWRSGKGHARSRDCDVSLVEPVERPVTQPFCALESRFAWCSAVTQRPSLH
jgi:hypothetical protein